MDNVLDRIQIPANIRATIKERAAAAEDMIDETELSDIIKSMIISEPGPSEIVLELGTFKGNTAYALAYAMEALKLDSHLVCIDAFDLASSDAFNPMGKLDSWVENNREWKSKAIVIRSFTKDAARLLKPGIVSLLIVDAYHEYPFVRDDIADYLPTVKPNGMIFVDDYNEQNYPGVFRATNELLRDSEEIETVKLTSYYAVFRKRG